jgi:hypothetical protein
MDLFLLRSLVRVELEDLGCDNCLPALPRSLNLRLNIKLLLYLFSAAIVDLYSAEAKA